MQTKAKYCFLNLNLHTLKCTCNLTLRIKAKRKMLKILKLGSREYNWANEDDFLRRKVDSNLLVFTKKVLSI